MIMPKKHAALITGSAKRLGKSIALHLASLGYDIALHYDQSAKEARQLRSVIMKNNVRCECFSCDLSNENKTARLIPNVLKTFPRLNVLINNASIFQKSDLKQADVSSFDRHFSIHVKAPFILSGAFADKCKKGLIINILDTNVVKNKTSYATYLLSKKSLHDLTLLSALAFAPKIRVNGIAPGVILPSKDTSANNLNPLIKTIPLKQKGRAFHITQAVQFLIENGYLTGQIIFADGGQSLV